MMKKDLTATEPQLALLRILWERGSATLPELAEALESERGLARTTVATMLSRMEQKKLIRRSGSARTFVYRAIPTLEQMRAALLANLTDALFEGEVTSLVSHLVESRQLKGEDLRELRKLIDSDAGKGRRK